MSHWQTKRIEELGRVVTGKTPSSDNPEEFGAGYPFITPSDIPATQKYVSAERFLSEKGKEAHKRILLPVKSVCVVCIGATIGKVCTTDRPSFSNQQINAVIPKNREHDPDFVYYLCTTLKDALVNFAGGAATPIVNKSVFSSIKVLVPDYDEQKKIAAILSAYDDLIENNRRRIALLEKMAEEIYREWFVRMRFPGHEQAKFEKGVPEGWSVQKVGEVFNTSSGGTPSRENAANYDGSICWAKTGELKAAFVLDTEERITDKGLENSSAKVYPKHTVVIAMYCAMPDISILGVDSATNQACCAFFPKHDYFHYTYSYLLIKFAQVHMIAFAHGAAQQNLSQELIKGFPLLVPSRELIVTFSKMAKPIYEQIESLMRTVETLKKTRDQLLPRLISGKLDVEKLDIQFPPSMLEAAYA